MTSLVLTALVREPMGEALIELVVKTLETAELSDELVGQLLQIAIHRRALCA